MTNYQPHARVFDLPGWPCPPRVRDIPKHEESWGWVPVVPSSLGAIAQDEMGYLWADGDAVPQFRLPDQSWDAPGAVVCWTAQGIGVWVHPKSLSWIGSISQLDMEQDRWVPVAVALAELPPFVKPAGQ
jgi:hypothetical protein